ncbi:16S rRNA (cytosine(967)-C(5))-methyltransferase [Histophilus somni]|uniref:16S rRNA (cytosine(967)-C(5))-methyltransferase RsmB n=1 Tax=Histophilus somni TaxID=731 RepID=UPI00094B1299|nr:16S rRNA (cytosine(967)-C(5))-methyltransferase RsmB [Histophilus somni]ARU64062.1 16S rRNA (cytosine(967)-C(5))-methyltransferase [Histophilus somni]ARU65843.1 16S rRNA (cytosine(967)-C(5))-methyltransferase [Histophilus somni]ARU67717.1 16S rRNA (cytosine(967)-C(5))-methyltransferase [Histophilus somni]ARU69597.1 16S rRNA (cytosine(967)-C(5))-methyltransferase [Histophilus somni]ARU71474.1 16S rRNA (cytosine(967)-C(5))-methyltransferase [Histophilus somni]
MSKSQHNKTKRAVKSTALFTPRSVRVLAAEVILQVLVQGKSLSTLLPEQQSAVKPQDFPLLQEICFGICRVLPRLERIIQLLLDKPLKGKTRIVHCLLLVGLYQILYTRIPAHAAVDEVVSATKSLKSDSFRGLLNAVLRRFLREQEQILAIVDKHWQTLHPEWLVNKLKQSYANWREIVEANNQKPPMWLRINLQHCSIADYQQLLMERGISTSTANHPQALRLHQASAVNLLPYFEQGWVSVQDLHAQWSALLLEPKNNELILDACAAPGGKTTHILEQAPNAKVIALDIEPARLQRVKENLVRMKQQAIIICGDATQPEQWLSEIDFNAIGLTFKSESAVQFDRILLDAPCSATGVIRRHPDIKWLRQESDITPLVQLQGQILEALWKKLKPQGILVYATCSLLPEENSQQIQHFLAKHNDAKLEPLPFTIGEEIGHQFVPTEQGGDGFYYAKLRKLPN